MLLLLHVGLVRKCFWGEGDVMDGGWVLIIVLTFRVGAFWKVSASLFE